MVIFVAGYRHQKNSVLRNEKAQISRTFSPAFRLPSSLSSMFLLLTAIIFMTVFPPLPLIQFYLNKAKNIDGD